MLANYASDPTLFPKCMNLIDSVFPGVKNMALLGMKYNACWDKDSTPFIIEESGEVVAHLGLIAIEMMLNQKNRHVAALHAICTKETFRGCGLFKQLMQEAMKYIENHYDSAILFTDQPSLYTSYGFSVVPEYDFIINSPNLNKLDSDLRLLSLDNIDDLNMLQKFLSHHLSLSNKLSFINEATLFILNNLANKLFFSQQLNAIIIFEEKERRLFIKDILSQKPVSIDEMINIIPGDYERVILQFLPDQFNNHTYMPVPAQTDGNLMVLDNFNIEEKFFRYPDSYRC